MPRVTVKNANWSVRNRTEENWSDPLLPRLFARCGAVGFLGATIFFGLLAGGHSEHPLSPVRKITREVAYHFGYLADEIRISELRHHTTDQVLSAISVKPGRALFGFDANRARRLLNNLDWVKSAQVRRIHPNQLEIDVIEREPFVVWQSRGNHYVIDREGLAMGSLNPVRYKHLPLLAGGGAKETAVEFVNHIEAYPGLKSRLVGASRVGGRRWNLYLKNGQKILLPEFDVHHALKVLSGLQLREKIFDEPVERVDLRFPGRIIVMVRETPKAAMVSSR